MTVSVHGYLNPTIGGQDGTILSEGTNLTNPIISTVQSGQESAPIKFGIRLVKSIPAGPLSIDCLADVSTDYTISTDAGGTGFNTFNNVSLASICTGWIASNGNYLKIAKNNGTLTITGYTVMIQVNASTNPNAVYYAPITLMVKDNNGDVIDSQTALTGGWISGVPRTFTLANPTTISSLTFTATGNGGVVGIAKIQLIVAGETLPTVDTVTVSAIGTNSNKWAFAQDKLANIASQCTLTIIGNVGTPSSNYSADGMAALLGLLTNGIIEAPSVYLVNLYSAGILNFALPAPNTIITSVVVKNASGGSWLNLQAGLQILCDGVVVATLASSITTPSSVWAPIFSPRVCSVIQIKASTTNDNNDPTEIEIYTKAAPTSTDYITYGSPLVITGVPAIEDSNIIIYAKCKASTGELSGVDTATSFKITCT